MTLAGPCLLALVLCTAAPVPEAGPWPADRYDPAGRRDPFAPLVAPDSPGPVRGVQDIPWQKLVLVGILDDPDGPPVALFLGGPAPRSHFLAPGARFRNGTLESVEPARGRVVIRGTRTRPIGGPARHVLLLPPPEFPTY
jgi:hypothetical protein